MNNSSPIDASALRASEAAADRAASMVPPTALLVEVERAVRTGSPERRVQMLRQVTALFLSGAAEMTESQIGVFDDILLRLIEWMDPQMLGQLSATLADSPA